MKKCSLLLLSVVLALLWATPASAQGLVVLTGKDDDDFGHTPPAIFENMIANLSFQLVCPDNGETGILSLGSDVGTSAGNWIDAVGVASGDAVTHVNGAVAIGAITQAQMNTFRWVHRPSPSFETFGGATTAERNAADGLSIIIGSFVNGGGILTGLTDGGDATPYVYAAGVAGAIPSVNSVSTLVSCVGVGCPEFNSVAYDGCCFHNHFPLPLPPAIAAFYNVLATYDDGAVGQGAYIGGCIEIEVCPEDPAPRTQGFWTRVCAGPHPSGENANLPGYVDCVNDTDTFDPVGGSTPVSTVDELCGVMNFAPRRDKCLQAEKQFMALLLNVCSDNDLLGTGCEVDLGDLSDAETVGDAIDEIDLLLSNALRTFGDCVKAQAMADAINTGEALP